MRKNKQIIKGNEMETLELNLNTTTEKERESTPLGRLFKEETHLEIGGMKVRERFIPTPYDCLQVISKDQLISLHDLSIGKTDGGLFDSIGFTNLSDMITVPKRYQRKFVKTYEEQQNIMRAILNGTLLTPLFISYSDVNGVITLELIDGQQRWTTLMNFVNNEVVLPEDTVVSGRKVDGTKWLIDLSGLTFNDILHHLPNGDDLLDNMFTDISLSVNIIKGTEEQVRKLFMELNTGSTGLEKIEVMLSHDHDITSWLRDMNDHSEGGVDFDKINKINDLRFGGSEFVMDGLIYWNDGPVSPSWSENGNRKSILNNPNVPTGYKNLIEKQLRPFVDTIPLKGIKEFGKGQLRWVLWMLCDLNQKYNLRIVDFTKCYKFFRQMSIDIRKNKGKIQPGIKMVWWLDHMLSRNSTDVIETLTNEGDLYIGLKLKELEFDLVEFTELSGMILRDKKRNVNVVTRWEILLDQDSKCDECGHTVHLGDDCHHIEEYWKGGSSEDGTNFVILHEECHKKRHKDDECSPETPCEDELESSLN